LADLEAQRDDAALPRRRLGGGEERPGHALAPVLGRDDHRVEPGRAEPRPEQDDRVADDLAVLLGDDDHRAVAAEQPRERGAAHAVPREALLELHEGVEVAPLGAPHREAALGRHPAASSFTAARRAGPTASTSPTMP